MSRKPYDELPSWCQPLRPWFGPPWYEQVEDLAGDDQPGEGYLAKAGRLTAARHQAEEIINHHRSSNQRGDVAAMRKELTIRQDSGSN